MVCICFSVAWLLLLLSKLSFCLPQQQPPKPSPQDIFTFEGAYGAIADTASTTYDWIAKRTGITEVCPFVDSITLALNKSLPLTIRGQSGGVDIILNAIASWEFQRRVGLSEPLVLAIAGSTGVGKSETAYQISDAIFPKKTRGWIG